MFHITHFAPLHFTSLIDEHLPKMVHREDADIDRKMNNYLKMRDSLTSKIRNNKEFHNPQVRTYITFIVIGYNLLFHKCVFMYLQILQKTVNYFGIKEISSNYPKQLYDPLSYKEGFDFEEDIRRRSNTSAATTGVSISNSMASLEGAGSNTYAM